MVVTAAIISVSSSLGYFLPAIIGLESMGFPSPGETALLAAAVLASHGKLQIWLVILIAIASAIAGDNLGYFIGRRLGREVLEAPGPFQNRRVRLIAIGDRFFDKYGARAVFFGRWVALIRFATAWLAGINEMRFRTFFMWNAFGAITWALTFGLAGYYGSSAFTNVLTKVGVGAAIALGVALVVVVIYLKIREKRTERLYHADEPPVEEDRSNPAP